jgi:hypothetical protein
MGTLRANRWTSSCTQSLEPPCLIKPEKLMHPAQRELKQMMAPHHHPRSTSHQPGNLRVSRLGDEALQ